MKLNLKGQIFGRYKIYDEAGAPGGMARVYLARDIQTQQIVAIKVPMETIESPRSTAFEQFQNELDIHRKIHHANIVRFLDGGVLDNIPYIVTEYLSGANLDHLISQNQIRSLKQAIEIIQQVLCALSELHRLNIFHNDISPENIRVTADGEVKLIDLGIAGRRLLADSRDGEVYIKPHYAAPELLKGAPPSIQTDIYALGVTFYQLLTGRLPHQGRDVKSLFVQHAFEMPPKPSELCPDIPEALSSLVMKMLAKDPSERFDNGNQIQSEIENILVQLNEVDVPLVYPNRPREPEMKMDTQSTQLPVESPEQATQRTKPHSRGGRSPQALLLVWFGFLAISILIGIGLMAWKFGPRLLSEIQSIAPMAQKSTTTASAHISNGIDAAAPSEGHATESDEEKTSVAHTTSTPEKDQNPVGTAYPASEGKRNQAASVLNETQLQQLFQNALKQGNLARANKLAHLYVQKVQVRRSKHPYWMLINLARAAEQRYWGKQSPTAKKLALKLYQEVIIHSRTPAYVNYSIYRTKILKAKK